MMRGWSGGSLPDARHDGFDEPVVLCSGGLQMKKDKQEHAGEGQMKKDK